MKFLKKAFEEIKEREVCELTEEFFELLEEFADDEEFCTCSLLEVMLSLAYERGYAEGGLVAIDNVEECNWHQFNKHFCDIRDEAN